MNNTNIRAGWIGLGAMGYHMAGHLAAAGAIERVWNRTSAVAADFARQHDIEAVDSPAALAADLDVVFLCISNDEAVIGLIADLQPGLKPGVVIVDTSTVSPATATAMAAQLEQIPAHWVDAPVSGGVEGARKGSLAVMAGADPTIYERILPLLQIFGEGVIYMGEVGSGQAAKAVNQVMVAGIAETVCEALALAEQLNLPQERLIKVLSSGAASSWFLQHRGKTMLADNFESGFKQSLLLKDLGICKSLARDLNTVLPVTELAHSDYSELVAAGDGDNEISGLIRLKRKLAANNQ
jgi:3-hydroxyisobutyrate dehydrogenase